MLYGVRIIFPTYTHTRTQTHTVTYPELATLFADHLPMLHHVDRTLVDRVVCFVSQPVLITLTKRKRSRDVNVY